MKSLGLFTVMLALVSFLWIVGCGSGDDSATDSNTGASQQGKLVVDNPTWDNFAQGFFAEYCTACHSSTLSGGDRNGAPTGIDFDTYEDAVSNKSGARSEAALGDTMPPSSPIPTDDERYTLTYWIDNGTPEK